MRILVLTIVLLIAGIAHADYTLDGSTAKGDVQIESVADAQKLRGVARVRGSLIIQNYAGADLAPLSSLAVSRAA